MCRESSQKDSLEVYDAVLIGNFLPTLQQILAEMYRTTLKREAENPSDRLASN
jgi:hypothetical protein